MNRCRSVRSSVMRPAALGGFGLLAVMTALVSLGCPSGHEDSQESPVTADETAELADATGDASPRRMTVDASASPQSDGPKSSPRTDAIGPADPAPSSQTSAATSAIATSGTSPPEADSPTAKPDSGESGARADTPPDADTPPESDRFRPSEPPYPDLKRFPSQDVWLDPEKKRVVLVGEVCLRRGPLEMFACLRGTKEHESIVSVLTAAKTVHTALLLAGAEEGDPVQFDPEYRPAHGSEIEILLQWKDADGKLQRARAQDWVRNVETERAMEQPWVFAGSQFWKDELTGETFYMAESGDFICVSNFTSALLDVPVASSDANSALMYEAFTERIPERGTKVVLFLTPKRDGQDTSPPEATN